MKVVMIPKHMRSQAGKVEALQANYMSRRATGPDIARASLPPEPLVEGMQTIVWARDLDKVDPRDIEACEDLLDAYFLMVHLLIRQWDSSPAL